MIPYMVGKLAPNAINSTRGLVKYVPGRGYFRPVPSQKGDKCVASPPPPRSLNGSSRALYGGGVSEGTRIKDGNAVSKLSTGVRFCHPVRGVVFENEETKQDEGFEPS